MKIILGILCAVLGGALSIWGLCHSPTPNPFGDLIDWLAFVWNMMNVFLAIVIVVALSYELVR